MPESGRQQTLALSKHGFPGVSEMNSKTSRKKTRTLEDIERSAWYARLAFGVYTGPGNQPPAVPEKHKPAFNVMP
jgi:hypothetical protein